MRRVCLCSAVLALLAATARAQPAPAAGVREVNATDHQLIAITSRVRFSTLIMLPADEEILDVVCGDKDFWVIDAAHNLAHLKPAKEGAATNLNLVTASGAVYSFLLTESAKAPTDLKVIVGADPSATMRKAKYYSANEVAEMQAAIRDARAAIESVSQRSLQSVADYQQDYPAHLQFPYRFVTQAKPFFVQSIWHDDTKTYIKASPRELPTLYEVADGAPSLVNFDVKDGLYVVPKVIDRGYLVLGKDKLEFQAATKGR